MFGVVWLFEEDPAEHFVDVGDEDLAVLEEGHGEQKNAIGGEEYGLGAPGGEEGAGGAFGAMVGDVEEAGVPCPFDGEEAVPGCHEGDGGADVFGFEDACGVVFGGGDAGEAGAGGMLEALGSVVVHAAEAEAGVFEIRNKMPPVLTGEKLAAEGVRGW